MRRFGLISLVLHAVLLVGVLLWFHKRPEPHDTSDATGAIELVMLEQQGAEKTTAPPPQPAAPSAPMAVPAPPNPPVPPAPSPPPAAADAEPMLPPPPPPPAPPTPPAVPQPSPPPTPPIQRAAAALTINLGGNSDANAIVTGPGVVPAAPDAKSRNRPPIYPPEAMRRAEQGSVVLLIHVSPEGLPSAVDVAQSSGYVLLDHAARDAVAQWRFLPAVEDGRPIAFDMLFRVVFNLN